MIIKINLVSSNFNVFNQKYNLLSIDYGLIGHLCDQYFDLNWFLDKRYSFKLVILDDVSLGSIEYVG